MKICFMDLETSSLNANAGIILCACIKELHKKVYTIRADKYKNWKTNKSDNSLLVKDLSEYLEQFDIICAHNGIYFDRAFLTAMQIKYGHLPTLKYKKFIDPYQICKRQLKIGRNSLISVIDFLGIKERKFSIDFSEWLKASHDSNTHSMDLIVKHCVEDVITLEKVYEKIIKLIGNIDQKGSCYN